VSFDDAFASGFGDYETLLHPESSAVCVPCAWSLGSKPPLTFRLWSLVHRSDREMGPSNPKCYLHHPALHATAKNDVREIVSILLEPPPDGSPWFVTIAASGQKHTLPFARLNVSSPWRGGWVVRFESEYIHSSRWEFARLLYHASALFILGCSREEIADGRPSVSTCARAGVSAMRPHIAHLANMRQSPVLRLVSFLLTPKEHVHGFHIEAARITGEPIVHPDAGGTDGGRSPVRAGHDGQRVDEANQPDGLVGAGTDSAGVLGEDSARSPSHGDAVRPKDLRRNADSIDVRSAGQLSLFD